MIQTELCHTMGLETVNKIVQTFCLAITNCLTSVRAVMGSRMLCFVIS